MLINEPLAIFQPAAALTTTAVRLHLLARQEEVSVPVMTNVREVLAVVTTTAKISIPMQLRMLIVVLVC